MKPYINPRTALAAALDRKVLAIIEERIGQMPPSLREIGERLNRSESQVDHCIRRLKTTGQLEARGNGINRQFHIPGKGSTLRKVGRLVTADKYEPREMPPKFERRVCFRCEGKIVNDEHVGACVRLVA